MLTWLFESLPKLINTLLVINFPILVRQYFAISIGNYEKKTSSYHLSKSLNFLQFPFEIILLV